MPFTNAAMAAHPAFRASLARLRDWGVTVLFGDDVMPLPRAGHRRAGSCTASPGTPAWRRCGAERAGRTRR